MAVTLEIKTASGKKSAKEKPERLTVKSPTMMYTLAGKKTQKRIPVVDVAIEKCQMIENLSGELSLLEAELKTAATTERDKSIADNTFVKTVDIEGSAAKMQIQFRDSYSALSADMETPLKEIFKEKFPVMFEVFTSRMLKQSKFEELKTLLGDRYDAFFEETTVVKATKDFQHNYFIMKESLNDDQKETVQKVLDACQSSPAVKYPK